MRNACVAVAALAIAGCSPQPAATPAPLPAAAAPKIASLPVSMAVKQRSTTAVPGADGELSVTVDDVTRGQVMVTLVGKSGDAVFGPVSMTAGASKPFQFGGETYDLKVAELANSLIGDDFVSLLISEHADDTLTEDEKIERLIAAVESLEGAVFIRNGAEYSANEAADHLREKLASAGGQVTSASKFIDVVASESSLTGKAYEIRMLNGDVLEARDYLAAELAKLESTR